MKSSYYLVIVSWLVLSISCKKDAGSSSPVVYKTDSARISQITVNAYEYPTYPTSGSNKTDSVNAVYQFNYDAFGRLTYIAKTAGWQKSKSTNINEQVSIYDTLSFSYSDATIYPSQYAESFTDNIANSSTLFTHQLGYDSLNRLVLDSTISTVGRQVDNFNRKTSFVYDTTSVIAKRYLISKFNHTSLVWRADTMVAQNNGKLLYRDAIDFANTGAVMYNYPVPYFYPTASVYQNPLSFLKQSKALGIFFLFGGWNMFEATYYPFGFETVFLLNTNRPGIGLDCISTYLPSLGTMAELKVTKDNTPNTRVTNWETGAGAIVTFSY